ncbi:hypothetical protein OG588_07565 [Streptomyces prunicolor]|uniref:hypothetical protein n=1 Tax=Streptomyces prunicolor TaxID=67348 RepID=UPI00386F4B0F|nr:hypothetical protein OG588_07565 [Streptomyces prunicolor]
MHRTTTTATLLVTVAVSALSGCVTVQRPAAPAPPAVPSHASVPRPDGSAEPQVVQAPAREALELIDPSHRPKPAAHPPHRAPVQPPKAAQAPVPRSPQHPHPYPHPHPHPKPYHPRQPGADIPDVVKSVPKTTQDVCALGKKYGGWQSDSPQSVICGQTYGR